MEQPEVLAHIGRVVMEAQTQVGGGEAPIITLTTTVVMVGPVSS